MSLCAPKLCLSAHDDGWQALVESNQNPHHKDILDSARGIFLFAMPHQNYRTDELEQMVDPDSFGQRRNLIMQLKEGWEFLEIQKEALLRIWDRFKGEVISFHETVKAPSVGRIVNYTSPLQSNMILT